MIVIALTPEERKALYQDLVAGHARLEASLRLIKGGVSVRAGRTVGRPASAPSFASAIVGGDNDWALRRSLGYMTQLQRKRSQIPAAISLGSLCQEFRKPPRLEHTILATDHESPYPQGHAAGASVIRCVEGSSDDFVVIALDNVPIGIRGMRPVDHSVERTSHSVPCAGGWFDQPCATSFNIP